MPTMNRPRMPNSRLASIASHPLPKANGITGITGIMAPCPDLDHLLVRFVYIVIAS
jgi:hypothetical protein